MQGGGAVEQNLSKWSDRKKSLKQKSNNYNLALSPHLSSSSSLALLSILYMVSGSIRLYCDESVPRFSVRSTFMSFHRDCQMVIRELRKAILFD